MFTGDSPTKKVPSKTPRAGEMSTSLPSPPNRLGPKRRTRRRGRRSGAGYAKGRYLMLPPLDPFAKPIRSTRPCPCVRPAWPFGREYHRRRRRPPWQHPGDPLGTPWSWLSHRAPPHLNRPLVVLRASLNLVWLRRLAAAAPLGAPGIVTAPSAPAPCRPYHPALWRHKHARYRPCVG